MVVSFFFSRADSTRNTVDPLVATLAYQIVQLLPEAKNPIVRAIESNPLIFEQSFKDQFDVLIMRPLCWLQIFNPSLKLLFIIDGVDECYGEKIQRNLICSMTELLRSRDRPFMVLFGSRHENQIRMAFNPRDMKDILTPISLDENYKADKDILRFLNDSFHEIKQIHPCAESLGAEWPLQDHVQEIANRTSGKFIYASRVINVLSAPSSNPSVQLDIIRRPRRTKRMPSKRQVRVVFSVNVVVALVVTIRRWL